MQIVSKILPHLHHKNIQQIMAIIFILVFMLVISGCDGQLHGNSVKFTNALVTSYNLSGQKTEQLKFKKLKITDDPNINSAIDLKYGTNKIITNSGCLLVSTNKINNYYDLYQKRQMQIAQNNQTSMPVQTVSVQDVAKMFPSKFKENTNVAVIKSSQGNLIGIFTADHIKVNELTANDTANTMLINLNERKIFVFNAVCTIYPSSAIDSMRTNKPAKPTRHQAQITTKQTLTDDSKNNKKA